MEPNQFDEFAKALATTTTRRQALRRIGSVLAGAGLASLLGERALLANRASAANGGNSDAAHFCNTYFEPGPDQGECTSDAARGTGLFFACGAPSAGTPPPLCCLTDSNGFCTSYSSATCCATGQTCSGTTCLVNDGGTCSGNSACYSGHCCGGTCNPGTCAYYTAHNDPSCGMTVGNHPCTCQQSQPSSMSTDVVCGAFGYHYTPCNVDSDCPTATGFYGDTGPGFCHTASCYATPSGYKGWCVPLCQ